NSASVTTGNFSSARRHTTSLRDCSSDVCSSDLGNGPLSAGGTATFTLVVTAGGTGDSTSVTVSDTLPSGTWTIAGTNGGSCSIRSEERRVGKGGRSRGSP